MQDETDSYMLNEYRVILFINLYRDVIYKIDTNPDVSH